MKKTTPTTSDSRKKQTRHSWQWSIIKEICRLLWPAVKLFLCQLIATLWSLCYYKSINLYINLITFHQRLLQKRVNLRLLAETWAFLDLLGSSGPGNERSTSPDTERKRECLWMWSDRCGFCFCVGKKKFSENYDCYCMAKCLGVAKALDGFENRWWTRLKTFKWMRTLSNRPWLFTCPSKYLITIITISVIWERVTRNMFCVDCLRQPQARPTPALGMPRNLMKDGKNYDCV